MLFGSPFYCAQATILGHISLSAGSRAVFQAVGLSLPVIVEAFGMLYWGIFPYQRGPELSFRLLV